MKKYKWIVVLFNLGIILFLINSSIVKKEKLLIEGKTILLELAPVDPRSLMQGDYMQLRYAISSNIKYYETIPKRGFCVVKLDSNNVAHQVRFQSDLLKKNNDEIFIEYTKGEFYRINIGAESYFFQEGEADKYEKAVYGALRIDEKGNSILIGLYNKDFELIK